tara:strand:- start:329 stop:580 length:252 start_codon:yes stop_codon:yes gene_type:complete
MRTEHDTSASKIWKTFSIGYKNAETYEECDNVCEALNHHERVLVKDAIQTIADMFGEECVDMRMLHYRNTLEWMVKKERAKYE